MKTNVMDMVRQFHEVFGAHIGDTRKPGLVDQKLLNLRFNLIDEEILELEAALYTYPGPCLIETADALADLVYVIYGAALAFGIPLDACIEEVHRSNMSKLGPDGKPIYREDGKVLKGEGYSPPDLAKVMGLTKHVEGVA